MRPREHGLVRSRKSSHSGTFSENQAVLWAISLKQESPCFSWGRFNDLDTYAKCTRVFLSESLYFDVRETVDEIDKMLINLGNRFQIPLTDEDEACFLDNEEN